MDELGFLLQAQKRLQNDLQRRDFGVNQARGPFLPGVCDWAQDTDSVSLFFVMGPDVRARDLSAQLDRSSPLRMQVLRQLRAQYAKASDQQGMRACEAQLDQLHTEAVERRAAELAALEVSEGAEGGGSSASASGAGTKDDGPSKPEQVLVRDPRDPARC